MTKDIPVPDQVLFGLIEGIINLPFKFLPAINAIVSLKKLIKINKNTRFLSKRINS